MVEQPKRAIVQITQRGKELLRKNPAKIDIEVLQQFDDFRSFLTRTKSGDASRSGPTAVVEATAVPSGTPDEQIAAASRTLDESLRDALLARILQGPGGTGDGGVDGIINEDQLGLDRVYLQAKRYKPGNTVGSETVQAFIGALVGRGAQKGVLITTSTFSKAAVNAANQSGSLRIVLIDGDALTKLMTRFNVGVRVAQTVEIKRVDLDYFEEAETE